MQYKKIKIYKFEELKPDIQENVINRFREENDFEFLKEILSNYLEELLKKYKIKNINHLSEEDNLKLFYSLCNCQGDGCCFIGLFKYKNLTIRIKHNSHYYHKRSTDIEVFKYDKQGFEVDTTEKQTENFKELYYSICDKIEKEGYEYIDVENDEINIKENIKINEYMFRKNGEIE